MFGSEALPLDKFSRTIGYRRIAEQTYKTMNEEDKDALQAYADGVNDFIQNVGISGEGKSASLLPPEFYLLSLADKIEPWTPIDSLS